jgi:hypothetical protein
MYIFILYLILYAINLFSNGTKKMKINFEEEFNDEKIELIMYYLPFNILTKVPLDAEALKRRCWYKIVVSKEGLVEKTMKFNKINDIKTTSIKTNPKNINLRLYCELKKSDKPILTIGLTGNEKTMLLNDEIIKNNKYFYLLLQEFIPASEIDDFKKVVNLIND